MLESILAAVVLLLLAVALVIMFKRYKHRIPHFVGIVFDTAR